MKEGILDKFSIDYIRNQVLKNAYGNDDTFIAKLDPRTLLIWYLFFGVVPWFVEEVPLLIGLFLMMIVTTRMTKMVPLLMFIFCLGLLSQSGYLLIVSFFFGGDLETVISLLILSLKIATVSLASVTVFSGMDPDKLANGLLALGISDQFSFSLSFSYRILPLIMEEFQSILLSYRLRGKSPDRKGFIGKVKYLIYQLKISIVAFYPLMLNMAKRSRTTVEALEMKGYKYSMTNQEVRRLKLSGLTFTMYDVIFMGSSIVYVAILVSLIG